MAQDVVKEKSTTFISATFYDEDGILATPGQVYYRLDDAESGVQIVDWTEVTPVTNPMKIQIAANFIVIIDDTKEYEGKRATVRGVYGVDDEVHNDIVFLVQNLVKRI